IPGATTPPPLADSARSVFGAPLPLATLHPSDTPRGSACVTITPYPRTDPFMRPLQTGGTVGDVEAALQARGAQPRPLVRKVREPGRSNERYSSSSRCAQVSTSLARSS